MLRAIAMWTSAKCVFRSGGLALTLFAASCGETIGPECPLPVESIGLVVEAGDPINPDVHGHSLPTIVRIYQLKSIGAIEAASFDAMWRNPTETLGESLVDAQQLTLFPGAHEERAFIRNPEARYIVGMVVVRRPGGQLWRTIVPMPASEAELACRARNDDAPEIPGLPEAPSGPPVLLLKVDNYAIRGEVTRRELGEGVCPNGDGSCALARATSSGGEAESEEQPEEPAPEEAAEAAAEDTQTSTLP